VARSKADRDSENLDDASMERVIKLLAEKGTKKAACQVLNISYNTARLDKLIEAYKEKKIKDAERRLEKRGKPATKEEVSFIVTEYLEGATVDSISRSLYRGVSFIHNILEFYGIPKRNSSPDYFHPALIPEAGMVDDFAVGERVYSARYDSLADIIKEVPCPSGKTYRIYLRSERFREFAYQPIWELASLRHLRAEGIQI
jgi:hypothetical protein